MPYVGLGLGLGLGSSVHVGPGERVRVCVENPLAVCGPNGARAALLRGDGSILGEGPFLGEPAVRVTG